MASKTIFRTPHTRNCDHYCDMLEKPSDDVIDKVQEQMMNNLGHLINDQFTDEHKGTFGIATRHGMDVDLGDDKILVRGSYMASFLSRI